MTRNYLASDVQAWKKTFRLGFTEQKRMPDMHPIKTVMKSAGSSIPRQITPDIVISKRCVDNAGPGVKENDIGRSRYWALASGNTFYTYPHYDASGMCTWGMLTVGTKVWSYLRPNIENDKNTKEASRALISIANKCGPVQWPQASTKLPPKASVHNLFLTPGTLL